MAYIEHARVDPKRRQDLLAGRVLRKVLLAVFEEEGAPLIEGERGAQLPAYETDSMHKSCLYVQGMIFHPVPKSA